MDVAGNPLGAALVIGISVAVVIAGAGLAWLMTEFRRDLAQFWREEKAARERRR